MPGTLVLVPTPIGNLGDISPRAVSALNDADFIAAEDTRVSLKLLNHLDTKKPLVSYHEHNAHSSGPKILARILSGETCALVTDAGTPAISDPGEALVRLCVEQEIPVTAIPGPCAAVTALAVSGLSTERFTFEGFLPVQKKMRDQRLSALRDRTETTIFYEAPHRLKGTLADLQAVLNPNRRMVLCRELTKLHEEILRMTIEEACAYYAEQNPRGEYVLLLEGVKEDAQQIPMGECLAQVQMLMDTGLSLRDAVRQASHVYGIPRNTLYEAAVKERKS